MLTALENATLTYLFFCRKNKKNNQKHTRTLGEIFKELTTKFLLGAEAANHRHTSNVLAHLCLHGFLTRNGRKGDINSQYSMTPAGHYLYRYKTWAEFDKLDTVNSMLSKSLRETKEELGKLEATLKEGLLLMSRVDINILNSRTEVLLWMCRQRDGISVKSVAHFIKSAKLFDTKYPDVSAQRIMIHFLQKGLVTQDTNLNCRIAPHLENKKRVAMFGVAAYANEPMGYASLCMEAVDNGYKSLEEITYYTVESRHTPLTKLVVDRVHKTLGSLVDNRILVIDQDKNYQFVQEATQNSLDHQVVPTPNTAKPNIWDCLSMKLNNLEAAVILALCDEGTLTTDEIVPILDTWGADTTKSYEDRKLLVRGVLAKFFHSHAARRELIEGANGQTHKWSLPESFGNKRDQVFYKIARVVETSRTSERLDQLYVYKPGDEDPVFPWYTLLGEAVPQEISTKTESSKLEEVKETKPLRNALVRVKPAAKIKTKPVPKIKVKKQTEAPTPTVEPEHTKVPDISELLAKQNLTKITKLSLMTNAQGSVLVKMSVETEIELDPGKSDDMLLMQALMSQVKKQGLHHEAERPSGGYYPHHV